MPLPKLDCAQQVLSGLKLPKVDKMQQFQDWPKPFNNEMVIFIGLNKK